MNVAGFGTLADEQAAYQRWGWTWTPDQEPQGPPNPTIVVSGYDPHDDLEADDLWQNLLMWKRTGIDGYRQLAEGWAAYYKAEYLTAVDSDFIQFGGDHLFGWGLIDWAEEMSDPAALTAAVTLGTKSEHFWTTTPWHTGYGVRQHARHLLLACRLWEHTGEGRWQTLMDRLWGILRDSPNWDATLGTWLWPRSAELQRTVSPVHFGFAAWALRRYHELTGDSTCRDRLIQLAAFARQYALHPTAGYCGSFISFDGATPFYSHIDDGSNQFYGTLTTAWCDALITGYRLTGDLGYLHRVKLHWQHGTQATETTVGRFLNQYWLSGGPQYLENGDLSYCTMLFYDHVQPPLIPSLPPDISPPPSLPPLAPPSGTWTRVDTARMPAGRSYSGIVAGSSEVLYFGGGHTSYPGNDVELFTGSAWEQSYPPEIPPPGSPVYNGWGTEDLTPLGRPYVEHTYQCGQYDPTTGQYLWSLTPGTWRYHSQTKVWTRLVGPSPATPRGDNVAGPGVDCLLDYDPDLGGHLSIITAGDSAGVWLFRDNWTILTDIVPLDARQSWRTIYSCYFPARHAHLILDWPGNFVWLDARTLTWTPAAAAPEGIDSHTYDSTRGVVWALHHDIDGVRLHQYDPSSNIWSTPPTPSIIPPAPLYGRAAAAPMFRYVAAWDRCVFVWADVGGGFEGGPTETWLYQP